jgi:putative restriction endonuclease
MPRLTPFATAEPELRELLKACGLPRTEPSYAFWRLQNDGLWEVACSGDLKPRSGDKEPRATDLRAFARGGFTGPVHAQLRGDERLRKQASELLAGLVAPSLRDQPAPESPRATVQRLVRVATFRRSVKAGYNHRCVICGWGPVHDGNAVGLEAAHIRSLSAGGQDHVSNGLALCANHHALFDAGFFSWNEQRQFLVSPQWGEENVDGPDPLLAREGTALLEPADTSLRAASENFRWHRRNVFLA